MHTGRRKPRDRRGASLALVAVSIVMVCGVGAIAIDLAMLYRARTDAQRAAEAGALAGASAFVDYTANDPQAYDSAIVRARRLAEANSILNIAIAPSEVQAPEVMVDSQKVRVVVGRPQIGTWFAKLLGVTSVPVNAHAAAVAQHAGRGTCVKPFAVPDTWDEASQDANGDNLEQDGEDWSYNPGDDGVYSPGNPDDPTAGNGYGSGLRNDGQFTNDFGRLVNLRLPDPNSPTPPLGPRQFRPFSPSGSNNPNDYRDAIEGCDPNTVDLGTPYDLLSPDPQVPVATKEGVDSLFATDPGAHWDDNSKTIEGSRFLDWRNSPRIIQIGLFSPDQIVPGQTRVTFNNLGQMFVEGFDLGTNTLSGRLFYFASGTGDPSGADEGTLVKRLRLVE